MGDLREETDRRDKFRHGLGLEMVVVDAMKNNVHHIDEEVDQVGSVALNQQLDLNRVLLFFTKLFQCLSCPREFVILIATSSFKYENKTEQKLAQILQKIISKQEQLTR